MLLPPFDPPFPPDPPPPGHDVGGVGVLGLEGTEGFPGVDGFSDPSFPPLFPSFPVSSSSARENMRMRLILSEFEGRGGSGTVGIQSLHGRVSAYVLGMMKSMRREVREGFG